MGNGGGSVSLNICHLHDAIRANYPTVNSVAGNTIEDVVAFDNEGNEVQINKSNLPSQMVQEEAKVKLMELRWERNNRLEDTDWWALSDRTMTQAQINYRQALRDITNLYSSLDEAIFPVKPE